MTIRQLHELTPTNQKIFIGWDGSTQQLNRSNPLELTAYGDFSIAKIIAISEYTIEADLLSQPVKE